MTLKQAQSICNKIESEAVQANNFGQIRWQTVYGSEDEIVADLAKIYIPENRTAPAYTFRGYEFIYSFACYVKKGWTLSKKQMEQCKRLAVEIKKAAAIAEYTF